MKQITLAAPGRRVRLELDDPEDHISRRIIRRRDWYERDLLNDVRRRAPRGTAIDIGAHIGNHSLWFAAVCGMRVVALEPNPRSFAQLHRNVDLNALDVTIIPAAVGGTLGRARLEEPNPGNSGMSYTVSDAAGGIPVVTVDSLGLDDVALIKIDVEGQELDILAGAAETLKRCGPLLYVEAPTENARDRLDEFLAPFGYRRFGRFALTPTYGYSRSSRLDVRLSATIMAHPRRQRFVGELIGRLDGPASVTWDRLNDRWETGRRSLLAVDPEATHHLVLQDDAVICRDLLAGAARAVREHPDTPISLYLGRQRPHGAKFVKIVAAAKAAGERWVVFPELCWGVALIVPRPLIDPIVSFGDAHPRIANYDKRISHFLESERIMTWYTVPSLVDHRAGAENPSLIPGRTGANRVAHWFIGADASPLNPLPLLLIDAEVAGVVA